MSTMPATRRTNGVSASDIMSSSTSNLDFDNTVISSASTIIPAPTHSPFFPTRTEATFLVLYPLTLFLGAAFSHLSPTLYPPFNKSTYSVEAQSFQPAKDAPSYFAQKRNVFNVYFVKIGWFWCTVALFVFTLLSSRGRPARGKRSAIDAAQTKEKDLTTMRIESDERLRRRWQTFIRWVVATMFWTLVTQWCFGPPLIDRGFSLTGGACQLIAEEVKEADSSIPGTEGAPTAKILLSHAACKLAGGAWRGGYDISGHVFILVLSSGLLWLETLPFVLREWKGFGVGRVVKDLEGKITRVAALSEEDKASAMGVPDSTTFDAVRKELRGRDGISSSSATTKSRIRAYAAFMALGVAGFSCWMLLMTAAYFHTWLEKLTGWLLAFTALWVVYFAPRGLPWLREVVGMPGV